jgi:hypothetical protein
VTWVAVVALFIAAASLAFTLLQAGHRGVSSGVRDQTRIEDRLTGVESRSDQLESRMGELEQKVELLPVISAQISALDRLVTFRLDKIETKIDGVPKRNG